MTNNAGYKSTVAMITSQRAKDLLFAYAAMFTASKEVNLSTVLVMESDHFIHSWNSDNHSQICGTLKKTFSQDVVASDTGLIVSEWFSHTQIIEEILKIAHRLRVPAVFIRKPEIKPNGRIVVATSGGPNVLQQIWVARETSAAINLPVHLVRIQHPAMTSALPHENYPHDIMDTYSRSVLHMNATIEVKKAVNIADAVAANVKEGDILVMGAPSALRMTSAFEGSMPHKLACRIPNPMILLSSPPNNHVSLRSLFWGDLLKIGLRPSDKKSAISALIENLARHNRLPHTSTSHILDLAMEREALMTTAADCETAFPHVRLRGFYGLVGSMAICPDGVDFESPDGKPSNFLFLLISPEGLSDEYLSTLSRIARRMILPSVRSALLKCKTASEAMNILDPPQTSNTNKEKDTPSSDDSQNPSIDQEN